MTKNSLASAFQSNEKRNFNFVMLRRGFREHLPGLSGNAVKLYVWLLLSAHFSGPKRGCVEASYEDIARSLRWNQKTLQRALTKMEFRYIEIQRAANQHELTTIRIIKYDFEGSTPAVDKPVQSKSPAVDSGADKFVQSAVHTNAPNSENRKELQAPKNAVEIKKEKNGKSDAVRRPIDAERPFASHSALEGGRSPLPEPTPLRTKSISSLTKRAKLSARLADRIRKNGNNYIDELDSDERAAFSAVRYEPGDVGSLAGGFISVVYEVYEEHENGDISPGNLCSKIIDRCLSEQRAAKMLGGDPSDYFWPPEFQEHRDRLREGERIQEAAANAELKKLQQGKPHPKPIPEEELARVVYSCLFPVELRCLLPNGIREKLDAVGGRILFPPDPDTLQRSLASVKEFIRLCEREQREPAE